MRRFVLLFALIAATAAVSVPSAVAKGGAAVSASPKSVSFGRVAVSANSVQTVTFTNTSADPLTILGPTPLFAPFSVDYAASTCYTNSYPSASSTLNTGDSCTVVIGFAPTAAGRYTATELVTFRDQTTSAQVNVNVKLTGAGV